VTEVHQRARDTWSAPDKLDEVAARALESGLRRVQMLAWRDLDDPEAGGSERHAHHVASRWADAGLDVTMRTSVASGHRSRTERDGYHVLRKGKRYSVFPRSALSGVAGRGGRPDGLVEIWNGMPFFSPLWARCPRITFLHHVHAEMWQMTLRPWHARAGAFVERRVAPPLYRGTRVVTLSESSRREIVSMLGLRSSRVSVVRPGIDDLFAPGGSRSPSPLVVAVGRLVPVKRFDLLIDVYRSAWVLASTSQREGWGMTISEAGACATPAVVSRIAGHVDAVEDQVSGLVADLDTGDDGRGDRRPWSGFAEALRAVLTDRVLRARLGHGARARADELSWDTTASGTLDALVDEAVAGKRPAARDGAARYRPPRNRPAR